MEYRADIDYRPYQERNQRLLTELAFLYRLTYAIEIYSDETGPFLFDGVDSAVSTSVAELHHFQEVGKSKYDRQHFEKLIDNIFDPLHLLLDGYIVGRIIPDDWREWELPWNNVILGWDKV